MSLATTCFPLSLTRQRKMDNHYACTRLSRSNWLGIRRLSITVTMNTIPILAGTGGRLGSRRLESLREHACATCQDESIRRRSVNRSRSAYVGQRKCSRMLSWRPFGKLSYVVALDSQDLCKLSRCQHEIRETMPKGQVFVLSRRG